MPPAPTHRDARSPTLTSTPASITASLPCCRPAEIPSVQKSNKHDADFFSPLLVEWFHKFILAGTWIFIYLFLNKKKLISTGYCACVVQKNTVPSAEFQGGFTTEPNAFSASKYSWQQCVQKGGAGREGEDSLGLITGFSLTQSPVAAATEGQGTWQMPVCFQRTWGQILMWSKRTQFPGSAKHYTMLHLVRSWLKFLLLFLLSHINLLDISLKLLVRAECGFIYFYRVAPDFQGEESTPVPDSSLAWIIFACA